MTRANTVHIPDLRRKIDLVIAVMGLRTDAKFAKWIGVPHGTMTGFFQTQKGERDRVRPEVLEILAGKVATHVRGLTLDQARAAWLSDFDGFFLKIATGARRAFKKLIERTTPSLEEITLHLTQAGLGAVDDDVLFESGDVIAAESRFQVGVKGPANAYLIVFVHSAQGWQFVVPRRAQAVKLAKDGRVRAPEPPIRFLKDGGLHTFYAFAIRAASPPSLLAREDHKAPIETEELDYFAVELSDAQRTKAFHLGRLEALVAPAK